MPLVKQRSDRYELSPLALWSSLERQLAVCGQTKGTPQQWIGTIRNLQKKGVSEVEIEWSMIIPTLEQHAAPFLQIDELLDLLGDEPPCQLVLQRHTSRMSICLSSITKNNSTLLRSSPIGLGMEGEKRAFCITVIAPLGCAFGRTQNSNLVYSAGIVTGPSLFRADGKNWTGHNWPGFCQPSRGDGVWKDVG